MRFVRWTLASAVVVSCAGVFALYAAPRADAHAVLAGADPADGASLSSPPSAVTLTFSEAPDPSLSKIDVLDTSGIAHHRGDVTGDGERLRVGVERLSDGVYTVSWRVVSRVDGHATAGAYAFGVGVSPDEIDGAEATSAAAPALSGAELAGRVLLYIGLLMLVGGAWVFGFAFRTSRSAEGRLPRQPTGSRTFMATAVVFAVAGLAVFALAQQASAGAPLPKLLSTPLGRALLQRAAAIAVSATAVVIGCLATTRRRLAWDVAGVAAAAAMFVHAAAGHAAAGGAVWFKVPEHFAHTVAAGVWIGGLAALLTGIRRAAPDERLAAVRRFSTVAGVALVVVAGSGTGRAYQEVGSWSGLVQTGYGRIVLGKVAGVAVLAGLGALNRWRYVRRADDDPDALTRTARGELVVAFAVLVLAGLLASLAPARSSRAALPSTVVAQGEDFTGAVSVRLEITPGRAGVNRFTAEVDVDEGPDVRAVVLRLSPVSGDVSPSRVELRRSGDRWVARGSSVATPGRWRATVTIDRGADSVEIPLAFHTACPQPSAMQEVGDLRLSTIDVGGNSVQAYVDPAKAGNNEVHFTLFDANGEELPLADDATITASRGEQVVRLDARKLSPGHFVAGGRLTEGTWVFDFDGETAKRDQETDGRRAERDAQRDQETDGRRAERDAQRDQEGGDGVIVCFEEDVS